MSTLLKVLVALGVALPLAAFVAGSLVAASDDSPTRERIIIQDDSTPTAPETTDPSREQDPGRKPPADDSDELGADADDDEADDDTDDADGDTDGSVGSRGGEDADPGDERDDGTSTGSGGGDDDTGGGDDDTDDDGSVGAVEAGGVRLDLRTRRATVGGNEVDLSAREFALAEVFMLNHGQVLSREQLLDHVWGFDFDPGSNVVDVYVGYLRKKFGSDSIATVRGMGYRFNG